MILAAGLGTRLRPWTLYHPKALVEVGGKPMLGRVIDSLRKAGFDDLTVNIHHFGDQIVEFLAGFPGGERIHVSDERDLLMDTGGGVVKASDFTFRTPDPLLVHNVDILSNANLVDLMEEHIRTGADATLLVSDRPSGRKLVFTSDMRLKGWHSVADGKYRPENLLIESGDHELAFSGIYILSESAVKKMKEQFGSAPFPIMDFFLSNISSLHLSGYRVNDLKLIDIGKPETLEQARILFP